MLTDVGMVVEGIDEVLEEIDGFSDWAYKRQGWVASRIKKSEEEREEEDKGELDILGRAFAIFCIDEKRNS